MCSVLMSKLFMSCCRSVALVLDWFVPTSSPISLDSELHEGSVTQEMLRLVFTLDPTPAPGAPFSSWLCELAEIDIPL